MAISSRAVSIPFLKFSSPTPPPRPFFICFNPTNVKRSLALEEKRTATAAQERDTVMFSVSGNRNLGSLRGGGAGLLERPSLDQSQFDPLPQVQEGGDIGRLSDKKGLGSGDSFRVLLIDDARHTEKLVEKALPQAIPSITISDARKLFHESRQKGVAVVIVTVKEHAEFYSQVMMRLGLRSAIEPDSNMA